MQTQTTLEYRGFVIEVKEQALMGFYCDVFQEDIRQPNLSPPGYYERKERAIALTKENIDSFLSA